MKKQNKSRLFCLFVSSLLVFSTAIVTLVFTISNGGGEFLFAANNELVNKTISCSNFSSVGTSKRMYDSSGNGNYAELIDSSNATYGNNLVLSTGGYIVLKAQKTTSLTPVYTGSNLSIGFGFYLLILQN